MLTHITSEVKISESQDPSILALEKMSDAANDNEHCGVVPFATCCSFAHEMDMSIKVSTSNPPRPPETYITADYEDMDDDFILTSRKQSVSTLRRRINKLNLPTLSATKKLSLYASNPTHTSYTGVLKRKAPYKIIAQCTKKRKTKTNHKPHKAYQGALFMKMYNLGIQADASNRHWFPDHLALAQSPTDKTPPVMHGVPSHDSTERAYSNMLEMKAKPVRISGTRERIVLEGVQLPEDCNTQRSFAVECIIIDQVLPAAAVADETGLQVLKRLFTIRSI